MAGNPERPEGTDLACLRTVRVLEARFHPHSKSAQTVVTVGRVICDEGGVTVERAPIAPRAVQPFDGVRLHGQLEFLVKSVVGDPVHALLAMRSGFWSFVELPTRPGGGAGVM
jgi:hypothetical protein